MGENTDYNVSANNRQIYKSIVHDANMRDQLPDNCTLKVDFLGRRTSEAQTKKTPAMVVTYNSEDLVYTGLKMKAALKDIQKYSRVYFRKSIPPEYKEAHTRFDKVRQSFFNVREGNRKIYEARIDFISNFMVLKVKSVINFTQTPWTIYDVWAPSYDDAKQISRPIAQPMLMPVLVAKIIPFEGSSTITQADRQGVGAGYREKLHPSIKHKCVYGIWNDRGSIFTMGFKLNCNEDLAALKSMENVFKEESHIHQFIIPFETAAWNPEDLPPSRRAQGRNAAAGNQTTDTQEQNPPSSGSQTANTGNPNAEQTSTALPQRETQNRGGSLPTE